MWFLGAWASFLAFLVAYSALVRVDRSGGAQFTYWQLAGWPLRTTEAEMGLHRCLSMQALLSQPGLHTGLWVCPGVWIPNRGYTHVFECARAFGY